MRYARYYNTKRGEYVSTVRQINMGDDIQSFAVEKLFQYAGIQSEDLIKLPFFQKITVEEPCYLVVQGHFGRQYDMGFMQNPYIHPIFFGFALKDSFLLQDETAYFKKYEPILCRDEFTKNVFTDHGVEAYLSGCLSFVFARRNEEDGGQRNKYYFVDVKDKFIDMLPAHIRENAVITSQNIRIENERDFGGEWSEKKTWERLEEYKKNAKMMVTSKLHCMIPSAGMGIPTIAVSDNFSYRYTFADLFIDAYDEEQFRNYDWHIPEEKVDTEAVKKLLLDVGKSMIEQNPDMKKIRQLDALYANRNKWDYCRGIKKQLRKAFGDAEAPQYILWGAAAGGYTVYETIRTLWPQQVMLGIADSFASGVFAGQQVHKPEELIGKYPNARIIVSTLSGRKSAEDFLQGMEKKKDRDYFVIHESL